MKRLVAIHLCCLFTAACEDSGNMYDTPRYEAYEASTVFTDGTSARHPVPGTVAQEDWVEGAAYHTGMDSGVLVDRAPIELTQTVLERGRERFEIYCSVCHGLDGRGTGMVVQRGFTPPPTFHQDRLRVAPDGYLFVVMTQGFGRMPSYAAQVSGEDRWAIIAYVRALQLSQHAEVSSLSETQRAKLKGGES